MVKQMENLDDFLNVPAPQEEQPEAKAEAPEAPEIAEEAKADNRDEKGRFKAKGEEGAPPAPQDEHVPVAAIKDERRKRQELEARLAEYEQRLQQLQNPPQPAPDMFEAPEQWQQHFGQQIASTATSQAALNARLDMSEMMAAQAHQDFDDVRPKILEFMEANPTLREQILSDRHPWNKAYQLVKNHERMTALGATDVSELEARIRAEVTAQIEAEAKAKQVEIPQSLASAGGSSAPTDTAAVLSIDQILGRASS